VHVHSALSSFRLEMTRPYKFTNEFSAVVEDRFPLAIKFTV
jgi:hypothetical protein